MCVCVCVCVCVSSSSSLSSSIAVCPPSLCVWCLECKTDSMASILLAGSSLGKRHGCDRCAVQFNCDRTLLAYAAVITWRECTREAERVAATNAPTCHYWTTTPPPIPFSTPPKYNRSMPILLHPSFPIRRTRRIIPTWQ